MQLTVVFEVSLSEEKMMSYDVDVVSTTTKVDFS